MTVLRNLIVFVVGLISLLGAMHLTTHYTGYELPAGEGDGQVIAAMVLFAVAFLCLIWLLVSYLAYLVGYESAATKARRAAARKKVSS